MKSEDASSPPHSINSPQSERSSTSSTGDGAARKSVIPLPEGFKRRVSENADLGWNFDKSNSKEPSNPPRPRSVPSAKVTAPAPAKPLVAQPEPEAMPEPEVCAEPTPEPAQAQPAAVEPKAQAALNNSNAATDSSASVKRTYTPAQLLHQKNDSPSDDQDVHYFERILWVQDAQTDEQFQASLQAELTSLIAQTAATLEASSDRFIQLALFDHFFEVEPSQAPVATLSWQSWLPDPPEVWVRGVRVSLDPTTEAPDLAEVDVQLDVDLGAEVAADSSHLDSSTGNSHRDEPDVHDDSEPLPLTRVKKPTVSQPPCTDDERIGQLFERMHELLYCHTLGDGAQYILSSLTRSVPARGILVHIFDVEKRQLVLVRARGPKSQAMLLTRTTPLGTHLEEALRRQETLKLTADPDSCTHGLWARLGIHLHHGLCTPVLESRRYLGAIELARESDEEAFSPTEVHALEYVAQQFADFLAKRSLHLDDASLLPRG